MATNLVPGDTNGCMDALIAYGPATIFADALETGGTSQVSSSVLSGKAQVASSLRDSGVEVRTFRSAEEKVPRKSAAAVDTARQSVFNPRK